MKNFNSISLAAKVREHVVDMCHLGGSSHVGSALSIVDILSVLYSSVLNYFPENPKSEERDNFILSKGHAGVALYSTLAEVGFFSNELLKDHYKNGSIFSGHVTHKLVPGIEVSTGSLGHGLGIGCGIAKAHKLEGKKNKVYVLISDGECDEGSNWEAFLFAAHHHLENLTVILDYNKLQSLTSVEKTLNLEPINKKLEAFNWNVVNVDGHNHKDLERALKKDFNNSRPKFIIANTIKGKGITFMENSVLWHYRSPQSDEYQEAKAQLKSKRIY